MWIYDPENTIISGHYWLEIIVIWVIKKRNLHDIFGRPENAVPVELLRGVEPKAVAFLAAAARASVAV